MIPPFDSKGKLPSGIHWATWDELAQRFGQSVYRRRLLAGLHAGLASLKRAGCATAYLDGSFVTDKAFPSDFDACWDVSGVNPALLDPILLVFDAGRAAQKAKYRGEFFPASARATAIGTAYLDFFQIDKETGDPKGVIALDLRGQL